jgi:hypothetical protein
LNASLEQRVRERTGQLEAANHELAETNAELRNAQVQLVQSEKLATLGRPVAGVAHEINNPVSFIASSIPPLRRRLTKAAATAPEAAKLLGEAEELVGIMARGAERTASIVKDLRSFSRLGEATRKSADLHEGLEVSLRLLEPRWRERIVVHRDFGALPPIDCDPGQLNQVFMNLLANAGDAIRGEGNIWVTTRLDGDYVVVTIRDDGGGIALTFWPYFRSFFTTKDVGAAPARASRSATASCPPMAASSRLKASREPGRPSGSSCRGAMLLALTGRDRHRIEPTWISTICRNPLVVVDDEPDILRAFAFDYGDEFEILTAESGPRPRAARRARRSRHRRRPAHAGDERRRVPAALDGHSARGKPDHPDRLHRRRGDRCVDQQRAHLPLRDQAVGERGAPPDTPARLRDVPADARERPARRRAPPRERAAVDREHLFQRGDQR